MNRTVLGNPLVIALIAIAAILLLTMTVSIVPETKQAIITAYGKPDRIVNPYRANEDFGATPGNLVARIPFIEQIQFIDKRIRRVEMARQEVLSTDQLRLQVDAYARFRITDPLRMYTTIRTEEALADQLRTILGSSLAQRAGQARLCYAAQPRTRAGDGKYPDRAQHRSEQIWRADHRRADQARRPARRHAAAIGL